MEDLPLGRIAALVPKFAVKDLLLGRTLMMVYLVRVFKMTSHHGDFWLEVYVSRCVLCFALQNMATLFY